MFARIKARLSSMTTLKSLCLRAEQHALRDQQDDALKSIGIDSEVPGMNDPLEPLPVQHGIYDASASGKQVVRSLADERQTHNPLLGAHVVAVIAAMRHGVAVRALRAMGVDAGQLKAAAEQIANGVSR